MLSYNPQIIRSFCLIFCVLLGLSKLQSQCNPPDQLPTVQCINAPLTCLQDACYSTSSVQDQGWNGFCGNNTAIHNPQYFEIIPIADCIQVNIHVDGCSSGAQLQAALVTNCQWQPCPGSAVPCADVLDCDAGTGVGGTMIINACGLTPGVSLWLLIDGSSGAQCQYTIDFAEGIYEPLITEEISNGGATPTSVCQGYDALAMEVGPSITNAHGYIWYLEWTGSFVTSTLPETTVPIGDNVPEGTYEVCVLAFSGCDTTDVPYCFEVEVYEIPDEVKAPATFCQEEFPFDWHTQTISGAGEYFESFEDEDGCKFDSSWVVEEYPEVPLGELEVLFCMNENLDPFFYEGEPYDASGTYELFYPNMGLNGCDSMAELQLTMVGIDAFIEHTCENGEFILTALIQELIPANADLSFEWYVDGVLTYDNNPMAILCEGTSIIELSITVETAAGECTFDLDPYTLNCNADKPLAPLLAHGDTLLCAQDGIFFCAIEDPFEPPLFFTWSSPGVPFWDDGSGCVEMDFSFSNGGQVCVYAENECGAGPTTCFNVEIIPSPVASFSSPQDVCSGTTAIISFTGSAGPNAQFDWDFGNPASVTGSGAGPYNVTWNIAGDKVINLLVIEPGCDTAFATGIVTVSNLQTPDVNCSSSISSVEFDWDDVVGSSGYMVSINGAPPVNTPNSEYEITGLSPGAQVNLALTIVSAGPCPNIVVYDTCFAVDCPAPTIELSGPNSLCLNSPNTVMLEDLVNGSPGNGTWSGPGIVDGVAGTFDPNVSGSGQHQVMYTVDFNGCLFDESYIVTVFDSITADFTIDPIICITDDATLTYTGNGSTGAMYDYNFGGGSVVSGSGSGPYQISFNTPGSKSVRLQVSENGCMSDVITQSLTVVASLTAPVVSCSSSTSGVTFSWTNTSDGFTYNVLTGQTPIEVSPTEIQFTGLVPGNVVELEVISLTSGPCPIRKDTFSCEARDCPMVTLDLKPVDDICLYAGTPTVDLEVTVTGGNGSGTWSGPGVTNTSFDPNVAGAGSHDITYRYMDDGCEFVENITVNVFDPPVAFISNTSLILTCAGGNMLNLDGSGSSGASLSYLWSTTNGAFLGVTNQDNADVGAPGTYQLKVTDNASGCVDSMSVTVIQDANTPTASAGPDRVITCDSVSFVLGGGSSQGPDIVYTWTTPNGNIVGPADGITVTVDEVGDYTITVRDNANGCQSIDAAMITIDTSVASITLTPGDTIDCNTTLSDVFAVLSDPVSEYDLLWTTPDGTISGSATSSDIEVSQGGTYILTITNKVNGCSRSASASVEESDEIIDAVDVTQTNVVCFGDRNGTLTINGVTGGTPDYDYAWSVSQGGGTELSSLGPGQYTLTVTDANGCTFTQSFTITEPPKVTADVGPDFTAAGGDSVSINLTTNLTTDAISNIDWSGYDGLNCPGCPSIQFIAGSSGTIIAFVTDTAGCEAIDSLKLTVIVPRIIFIPTVFSPNGDSRNDFFYISGRFNLVNIPYLRIFDRWGNQVFDATDMTPGNENEGWDGTYKEQPMQPGVYVYTAKLEYEDEVSEVVTGSITIIR